MELLTADLSMHILFLYDIQKRLCFIENINAMILNSVCLEPVSIHFLSHSTSSVCLLHGIELNTDAKTSEMVTTTLRALKKDSYYDFHCQLY